MLRNVKAIIFDLDGVITDTSVFHEKAWRKMAQEKGIPFDDSLGEYLRGVSRQKSLELILESAGVTVTDEEFQRLMDKKNNYYKESLENLSPINPEMFCSLRERGYKLAIASSSKNAQQVIDKLGIRQYFDAFVDGTEITRSKPDPEVFLKAAGKLGLPPQECVVVEDAEAGMEAARMGGFVAIYCKNPDQLKDVLLSI